MEDVPLLPPVVLTDDNETQQVTEPPRLDTNRISVSRHLLFDLYQLLFGLSCCRGGGGG